MKAERFHSFSSKHIRIVRTGRLAALLALAAVGSAPSVRAQQNAKVLPPVLRDVGIDQKLNAQIPLDLQFQDSTGRVVKLGDYFGGKPVLLALVYYNCPMLCTVVLNDLTASLKQLKFDVGQQFEVVTVSIDPTETPALAAAKKALYVSLYGRPGAAEGWHFLTGSEASIRALADAVGFRYHYDPQTKQYIHATGIMIATPHGRLARYFYGIQYPAGDLRLGLVEASAGKIGNPVDELLLYCCEYDPATGKYSLVVSRALKVAGVVTLLCLGTMMLILFRSKGQAAA